MRSSAEQARWERLFEAVGPDRPRPGFLDGLERRLREETAKRAVPRGSERGRPRRFADIAAAAALLIAAGLALVPWGDGRPTPEVPPRTPAPVLVAVHATPPVHAKDRDWSLTELIAEADVILAGRFEKGGHESSFRVDRVLEGDDPGAAIRLLTENGLRCPAPAVPRAGAWAVVFAVREDGALAVPSRAWLRQFRTEREREEFAGQVALRREPDAADRLAERIREARRADADAPFDKVAKTVRDLGRVGGIRAAVALMELHHDFGKADRHGLLLDALAGIRLGSAAPVDLAADTDKLREAIEASGKNLDAKEVDRLLARLEELAKRRRPDRSASARPEAPIRDAAALRDRLQRLNASLRRSVPGAITEDPAGLRRGAAAVRAALAREVATDDRWSADQRAGALAIAIRHAPDALSGEEVGTLIADAKLPYFLRHLAVKLAGQGRLAGAVPMLFDLLTAKPPEGSGPEPHAGWRHGAVSWRTVQLTAVDVLARIGRPDAVRRLRNLGEREDLDEALRRAIARSLGQVERRR
jgi:hypothetical protein